jgi:pyruvate dehydrogenase (quinone)
VTTWAARYVNIRGRMMFSSSGMLATMGNSLPYSVGAAVAYPGRQVVCLSGDRGFTMLMGEMATLVKYQLPVKVIIIKNNSLGQIRWEQMVFERNPEYGCDLHPIDFARSNAEKAQGVVAAPGRCPLEQVQRWRHFPAWSGPSGPCLHYE